MKKGCKQVEYFFNAGLSMVENFEESEFKFAFKLPVYFAKFQPLSL